MRAVTVAIILGCALASGACAGLLRRHHDRSLNGAHRDAIEAVILTGEPATVSALNVTNYLGRWYEVYQDWVTANTFQRDSFCATADYEADPTTPGRVTVSNREHYGSITGPQVNVSGYAFRPNATAYPGRLTVVLHGDHASPFPAPYWVLRLGPIVDGRYDFAVVSDSMRLTLFVLARDVQRFRERYETDVLAWLGANGFDQWWNTPILLPQSNCTYFPAAQE